MDQKCLMIAHCALALREAMEAEGRQEGKGRWGKKMAKEMVSSGLEPETFSVLARRATNCATKPGFESTDLIG